MAKYITDLQVSLNAAEEQMFKSKGFKEMNVNLNIGAGGNAIRLWSKLGSVAITRVQVSFNEGMVTGLNQAGFTIINKDLNAGAGGSKLYLWYFKGSTEFDNPIKDITVTADAANDAEKFAYGWERVALDLNRKAICLWLKREKQTYICNVAATASYGTDKDRFENGYIRVDKDVNKGAGGANVFIWYRQTTDPKRALTDIQVSITDFQYQNFQAQGYHQVGVDLNGGTKGPNTAKVFLWYKNMGSNQPIKAITLLFNPALVPNYLTAGVSVIQKNLNTGTDGRTGYLCVFQ